MQILVHIREICKYLVVQFSNLEDILVDIQTHTSIILHKTIL